MRAPVSRVVRLVKYILTNVNDAELASRKRTPLTSSLTYLERIFFRADYPAFVLRRKSRDSRPGTPTSVHTRKDTILSQWMLHVRSKKGTEI